MMFKRIDHIEIVTDQLDRTVQFYTEVLGFTVKAQDRIERSGLGVPIDLVYLDLGGTVVELISYEGVTVDPAPQTEHLGYRMMALEVDDMQKNSRLSEDQGCRLRLGSKAPRDLFKGGDLRPQRLPHRAQAVVPVSGRANDKAGEFLSWRPRVD
jgi:catechol 2,3-dioxygenase-like lactoylglutathione lyase family enzyme